MDKAYQLLGPRGEWLRVGGLLGRLSIKLEASAVR